RAVLGGAHGRRALEPVRVPLVPVDRGGRRFEREDGFPEAIGKVVDRRQARLGRRHAWAPPWVRARWSREASVGTRSLPPTASTRRGFAARFSCRRAPSAPRSV